VQYTIKLARNVCVRRKIMAHKLEAIMPHQVRDVVGIAGDEVVETYDVMTVSEETIGEV
jgi:hypothetical protein